MFPLRLSGPGLALTKRWGGKCLNFFLPPICPVTHEPVEADGLLHASAWQQLVQLTPPFCPCCGEPVAVVDTDIATFISSGEGMVCADCLQNPPAFDAARGALIYNEASRKLVLAFKNGDQQHLRRIFAPLILRAAPELLTPGALLVPVPLHWLRLLARRFNQSGLLAASLSQLTGLAYAPDILVRTRHTTPQGQKKKAERGSNVRAAFKVNPKWQARIAGQVVVLVDDVMTTGATLNECALVLKAAGAAQVRCVAVARAVKDM